MHDCGRRQRTKDDCGQSRRRRWPGWNQARTTRSKRRQRTMHDCGLLQGRRRMPHLRRRKPPTRPQDRLTAVGLRIKSTPNTAAAGQLVALPVAGAVSAMQAGAVSAGQAGDHSSAAVDHSSAARGHPFPPSRVVVMLAACLKSRVTSNETLVSH